MVRQGAWTELKCDFQWGGPQGVPTDNFSYEFRRREAFPVGWYRFVTDTDDGVRVDVGNNGSYELDQWGGLGRRTAESDAIYGAAVARLK